MARPSAGARLALEHLKDTVIDLMLDMPIWHDAPVESLRQIPLGVLRKNATQRHGVTRWRRGVDLDAMQVSDVEVIDLHPQLLDAQWSAYAAFVLHHEYIHALGFRAHDSTFRRLEAAWPGRAAARRRTHGPVGALAVDVEVEPHGRRRAVDEPDLVGRDRPRLRELLAVGVALRRLHLVADAGDEKRALDEGVALRRAGPRRVLLPDPAADEDLHAVITSAPEHHGW